ncbi:MAG: hypothetical protein KA100_06780, partial [Rickettsiales bacterium]|nr:hypothetical protein [Rickettsiales bacterium]
MLESKKTEERKYLEDLTRQNSWDSDELQAEAVKVKTKTSNIAKIRANKAAKPVVKNVKKLLPTRGKLFSYPQIVDISKKDKNYSLKKSQLGSKKINVYKAFITRVVDGDTLHVVLDLG